jgi:hypothetical protein
MLAAKLPQFAVLSTHRAIASSKERRWRSESTDISSEHWDWRNRDPVRSRNAQTDANNAGLRAKQKVTSKGCGGERL